MMAEVGFRVIRGPDWPLHDEDGGEGCVGTVVEVGGKGKSTLPNNLVIVQWDMGNRQDHRAGYYGDYDLCLVDSAPAGIKHNGIHCNNCHQKPIYGMRWSCLDCAGEYDLCTSCYMFDEHEKTHEFDRIDKPGVAGVNVGKRMGVQKIQKKGIFKGAKVARGPSWSWDDQDGGRGKDGVVLKTEDWKPEFPKSSVKVSWAYTGKQNYRVGYKGKVDLKCLISGIGGLLYKEHLPKLGEDIQPKHTSNERIKKSSVKKEEERKKYKEDKLTSKHSTDGDGVKRKKKKESEKNISLQSQKTKENQTPIKSKSAKSQRSVQSSSNAEQKSKTNSKRDEVKETAERRKKMAVKAEKQKPESRSDGKLQPGDKVRILADKEIVEQLQAGHGDWNDEIAKCVGQLVEVVRVDENDDVEVLLELNGKSKKVVFNSAVLHLENASTKHNSGSERKLKPGDKVRIIEDKEIVRELQVGHGHWNDEIAKSVGQLVEVVRVDEDDDVEVLLELNGKSKKVTFNPAALHIENISTSTGTNISSGKSPATDQRTTKPKVSNGDFKDVGFLPHTPLDEMQYEVKAPSYFPSPTSELKERAIHFVGSAGQGNLAIVQRIFKLYPEIIDFRVRGQTALHQACARGRMDVVDFLLNSGASLTIKDQQEYTALHHSAYSDRVGNTASIVVMKGANINDNTNPQLATPMHLAVLQDNINVVHVLVQAGCDLTRKDINGETPLHTAVRIWELNMVDAILSSGNEDIMYADNSRGANPLIQAVCSRFTPAAQKMIKVFPNCINAKDKHGMTALHYAAVYEDEELAKCILQQENCNVESKNEDEKTAFDLALAADSPVQLLLAERLQGTSGNSSADVFKSLCNEKIYSSKVKTGHSYQTGDLVKVRSAVTVVRALAHYHGEWVVGMKDALGKIGHVLRVHEDDGDLDVEMQNGLKFRLNSLAVISPESQEETDDTATKKGISRETSTANLWNDLQQICGMTDIHPESIDLSLSDNEANLGSALFQAIGMRMTWRVKEILELKPSLANHIENGLPVLNQAARDENAEIVEELLKYGARVNPEYDVAGTAALFDAAISDTTGQVVELLLKQEDCNPNYQNSASGHTALHAAVLRGNLTTVKVLVKGGCDLSIQNFQGNTVFHEAAMKDRVEIFKVLLETQSVDLRNLFNGAGLNLIHIAAHNGNVPIVQMMLEQAPDLATLFTMDSNNATALHVACLKGHLEVVNALLDTGLCDLRAEDAGGRTPLAVASDFNKHLCSLRLIEEYEKNEISDGRKTKYNEMTYEEKLHFEADDVVRIRSNLELLTILQKAHGGFNDDMVQALNKEGQVLSINSNDDVEVLVANHNWVFNPTALILVRRSNSTGAVKRTGERKKPPQFKEWIRKELEDRLGSSALDLNAAVSFNHLAKVQEILARNPEKVNDLASIGTTVLHLACNNGFLEIIKCLLEHGAAVNMQDEQGRRPLQVAAKADRTGDIVSLLIEKGADPNAMSEVTGMTCLHDAVLTGHPGAARALVEKGAKVNVKDINDETPFTLAIKQKKDAMVDILLKCSDYDPTFAGKGGYTALHHASRLGNEYAVQKLIEHDSNNLEFINLQTETDGSTALLLAAENNKVKVARLLLQTGKCEMNKTKNTGQTPLDVAIENNHSEMADLLREYRAEAKKSAHDNVKRDGKPLGKFKEARVEALGGSSDDPDDINESRRHLDEFYASEDFQEATSSTQEIPDEPRATSSTKEIPDEPRTSVDLQQKKTEENTNSEPGNVNSTPILLRDTRLSDHKKLETTFPPEEQCIKCKTSKATVIFYPCKHKITCEDCSFTEKMCSNCDTAIEQKSTKPISTGEEKSLETSTNGYQNNAECIICNVNNISIAFHPCRHCHACAECAKNMTTCPICREEILERHPIYFS